MSAKKPPKRPQPEPAVSPRLAYYDAEMAINKALLMIAQRVSELVDSQVQDGYVNYAEVAAEARTLADAASAARQLLVGVGSHQK